MKKSTFFISALLALLSSNWNLKAQTTILSEDFEGGQPSGWTITTLSSDGGWSFGTSSVMSNTGFQIPGHTQIACTNDNACSSCDKSADYFITPIMDLSSKSNVLLTFYSYFYHGAGSGSTEKATVEVRTNGGAWTVEKSLNGVGNWTMLNVDLSDYDGQSNVEVAFHYDDDGGWLYGWAIDDVTIYEKASVDLSVSTVAVGKLDPIPVFVNFPNYLAGLPLTSKVAVVNTGLDHVTSFDLSLTDGVNIFNESITGVNLNTLGTYTYSLPQPYTMPEGDHTLTATISNINGGSGDFYSKYNNLNYGITGIVANPDKKYLAEEATGTWCGYCVRGIVFMDYMREQYPDQFVGIAVHNGDPMAVSSYDSPISSLVGYSYPNVAVDRTAVFDPSFLEYDFLERIAEAPAAKVSVSAIYSPGNNQLSITATGEFLQDLSGDYRFACVIVEDSVHGTASGYKQSNYYGNNALGSMGGFEDLGGSIPASQMYYEAVGRALVGGFKGVSGSLPATINAGDIYSHDFTYGIPSTININHTWVVAMILNYDNGEVINVDKANWMFNTGINEPANASVFVYPNPANDIAYVDIRMANRCDVTIQITDGLGRLISSSSFPSLSGSEVLPLNITGLNPGLYQVQIKAGAQTLIRKLLIAD